MNSRFTKALIILTGSMGDIIRFLHARKLVECEADLSLLVNEKWAELQALTEAIKFVPVKDSVVDYIRKLFILRKQNFDIVWDAQRLFKSGLLARLLGDIRCGFHPQDAKEFSSYFNNCFLSKWGPSETKVDKYIEFFSFISSKQADRPPWISIHDSSVLAVSLGGSWQSKKFPIYFSETLNSVIKTFEVKKVFLLGGKDVLDLSTAFAAALQKITMVENLCGKLNLSELIDFTKNFHSGFGIGGDTGLAHLFAFFGKPYISIFGPSSKQKNAPFGLEHLAIQSTEYCSPCEKKSCVRGIPFCLSADLTERVVNVIRQNFRNQKNDENFRS